MFQGHLYRAIKRKLKLNSCENKKKKRLNIVEFRKSWFSDLVLNISYGTS